ncbi:hypothetical protein JJQ72_16835 [Paenibacillus sp. F411]|uniref:hypothetical protein n=1 Tax=Paenibacillus sp. F411 TaxID=2820239 RepID=UPI001AAF2D92|nr:hypothetical protein [Paenibacillus sp. F411]MBO2945646.1 hypothetical protein [Paenibacillus sp. F411]
MKDTLLVTQIDKNRKSQTRHFRLEYNGRSIEVALGYVATKDEVQASYLTGPIGKENRWGNPTFVELIEKYIGYKVPGNRKDFIRRIYYSAGH